MKVKRESEKTGLKLNIQETKIMASISITLMANKKGKIGSSDRFYFLGFQNHCRLTVALKLKDTCSLKEKL